MCSKIFFLIPVKAKRNCKNWEAVVTALQRTIDSISGQSDQRYEIWVASDDVSILQDTLSYQVNFISTHFDPPDHRSNPLCADKHKRHFALAAHLRAKYKPPLFLFFLDADDLLHRDFVKIVLPLLSDGNSVIISHGWSVDVSTGRVRWIENFPKSCGSSVAGVFEESELPLHVPDDWYFEDFKNRLGGRDQLFLDKYLLAREGAGSFSAHSQYLELQAPLVCYLRNYSESISRDSINNRRRDGKGLRWLLSRCRRGKIQVIYWITNSFLLGKLLSGARKSFLPSEVWCEEYSAHWLKSQKMLRNRVQ